MHEVTKEQITLALQALGFKRGDGVLVHSAIQYLGRPAGGVGIYFSALCEVLGIHFQQLTLPSPDRSLATTQDSGTLVVPTFNFAFARGEPYDPQTTPSAGMGVFSEYVRQRPEARRTPHPMQSLAVVGYYGEDLTGRDTLSAFDPGSAFERMLELDFKLLLLGADVQAASILHYSEQRAHVPYRYWKDFTGRILTPTGWTTRTYRMFVRDIELDPQLDLHPVQEALQIRSQWQTLELNYGYISLCRLSDFVVVVDEILNKDPWALVANRPQPQQGV